jgi:hypothetical protein
MVVDTTHCLVAGAILLGKEELNIVSWTGYTIIPALRGNFKKKLKMNGEELICKDNRIDSVLLAGLAKRPLVPHS